MPFGISNGLSCDFDSPTRLLPGIAWLIAEQTRMTRPLRSTPITGASPLLRAGPPACRRNGTLPLTVSAAWGTPSPHPPPSNSPARVSTTPSHVPCRSRRPGSRRLHAGHHLASRRVSRQAHPGAHLTPRFRCHLLRFDTSSAVRLRSPSRSPPDASYVRLFPNAHHDGLQPTQLEVVWHSPRRATPKGHTSISCTAAHQESRLLPIRLLSVGMAQQCHLAKVDLGGGVLLRGVLPGGRHDRVAWQTMAW